MKFALIVPFLIISSFLSFSQQNGPINSGDLIHQGIQLYDSGQYKKALEFYDLIDRNDTNYIRSLYEKSITCQADSQYDLGLKYCEEGLAIRDDNEYEVELCNSYGNLLNIAGQSEKSIRVFDEAIKKYPSYSLLYFNKGVTLYTMNRFAEAEEVFKQTLLVNPYQYSAHYYLGISALAQGKIIPAFLSLIGYLSIYPDGKYSSRCINLIDAISKSKDEIQEYKSKATGDPDENFEVIEAIVLSKVALEKGYKLQVNVDDPVTRQMQVVFEKLQYKESDTDFWMQFYVPFYKAVFDKGQFEPFVNWAFSNVNIQSIKDYNRKNKKTIDGLTASIVEYYNQVRATRELPYNKRETQNLRYFFSDGVLLGKGILTPDGKNTGAWTFYYPAGNIKAKGEYGNTGLRENEWLYYYYSGKLKGKEWYKNGKLEGEQIYYTEAGNESSHSLYSTDLLNGRKTVYYTTGQVYSLSFGKMGKDDGEYREYYSNGNLRLIKHFNNSIVTGAYELYYNNGILKESGNYRDDQIDGPVKEYYDNGAISSEGVMNLGVAEGEWKYYYDNGKLKSKVHFVKNKMEGVFEEYFDNGKIKSTSQYKNGLANGETILYDKDGILSARYLFDNDIPKSARFFDKSGKQIGLSERKGNELDMTVWRPQGSVSYRRKIDGKGKITGLETSYFVSGKISGTSQYKNGDLNGPLISYYRNGRKQSETEMVDGKKDGRYTGYYSHGQVQSEGWYSEDQAQGLWNYYDELGNLSSRSYFINGELSGYKEEFSPNGRKTLEEKYKNGWLTGLKQFDSAGNILIQDSFPQGNGKYLLVYQNGNKMEEGTYKLGFLNGPFYKYFFDGSIGSIQYYKNGLLDSVYQSYFYKGSKKTEGRFSLGKKSGTWKVYDDDGILNYSENYRQDQLEGPRIYYYPDGSKEYEFNFKEDDRDGLVSRLEPDGTVAYTVRYDEGDPVAYTYAGKDGHLLPEIPVLNDSIHLKALYPNGKISRECFFSDGKTNGFDRLYYQNGQLYSVDSSEYSVNEGAYLKYFSNGKLKSSYNYLHDNPHGTCREYRENGSLQTELIYWNGDLHGPARYYGADGKLTETRNYYYGTLLSVKYEK